MTRIIEVAVLTVSDRCSSGVAEDTSGPTLVQWVETELSSRLKAGARVVVSACIPDERQQISSILRRWALEQPQPQLILTTGGTGFAPRDVTPEATREILERLAPGLLELARLRAFPGTPHAFLSRGEAGTLGQSLIINLPGSPRGALETVSALIDVLPHALATLQGDGSHAPSGA